MSARARTVLAAVPYLLVTAALAFVYRRYVFGAAESAFTWARGSDVFVLRSPRLLGVLLLIPFFFFMMRRSLADLPWQQKALSVTLRLSFLALLVLGLARVSRTEHSDRVCTVFLADVSDSVTTEAIGDARAALGELLRAKRPEDRVRVVTFARRPRIVDLPEGATEPPELARHDAAADQETHFGAGTNLQAALQLAYGLYPAGYLRRAVLFSDGVETDGDLRAEANRARQFGVKLTTEPYLRPPPGEVAVEKLTLPDRIRVGDPFEVHAGIYASRAVQVQAKLFQGEVLNGLDGVRTVELKPGDNDVVFPSVVRVAGEVTYRIAIVPAGEDKFEANNHYATTVDVPGRPSVLYIEGEPGRSTPLASALEKQGFDVDVRTPASFPGSLKEFERFDFFVLSDTPADQVSLTSQGLIESYLREVGGGFLFAGGPHGYGPGGWYHSTVERILPVRMDAERRKDMPSVAMSLVIDRSGSMTGLPLEMAKQAARATVDTLSPDDLIEVIAFDSAPVRFVKLQPAKNRARIEGDIARIQAGGGTEIFPALDASYQDMSVVSARKKHVILLTDGRAASSGIRDLVQAMAAESITVTTVGLGGEVDDQLLSMIKDFGGGRYHKVPDPNSLPKIFTREAEMVAKSAATVDYFPVRQTSPADFLRGIDVATAPLLGGYTATKMKPAPAQEILQNPDQGDPILARWRVGLGYALAWTSDVKSRWAADWTRWPGWPQLWGQLVREHMRQRHRTELDMKTEVVSGEVHATIDAFGPDDRFDNGLDSRLFVIGPEPGGERREVPMRQTAPGRYEARFPLDRYGSFLLRAEHRRTADDGKVVPAAVSYGHVSNPYPLEYASFEPDQKILEQAASATGGLPHFDVARVLDPGEERVTSYQDLWPRLVGLSILVLLLDLLMRRVRLFDRKFLPKAKTA